MNDNGCESARAALAVTVNPLPAAPTTTNIIYYQNAPASPLTATGQNLRWYTSPTGGTSYTSVTPSTVNSGTTTYYVSQVNGNGCESERTALQVTVAPLPTAAPVLMSPVNNSSSAGLPSFTGTAPGGSTVTLYLATSGGTAQAIGTTTATMSGNFSLTPPTSLPDGSYTAYATAQSPGASPSANSNSTAFTVDATAPTATFTSSAGTSTSAAPIPFTVTFSKAITGFTVSDLTVSNGTVSSALTSTGNVYGFSVTPTSNGPVTVSLPAGAVQDAVGNPNLAAGPLSVTYLAGPTLTSFTPASGPVGTQVTLTGQNLGGTSQVTFNGVAACSFSVVSATTVTATVPAGATTGPVALTAPGGPVTATTAFTVTAPVALAVVSTRPGRNTGGAAPATPVALTYNQAVDPASTGGLRVFSHLTQGRKAVTASTSGPIVTLTPAVAFQPGETVWVTSPASVRPATGSGLASVPTVYQFTTAAGAGPGTFGGGANLAAGPLPASVALADVNGDGRLDVLATNGARSGTVTIRLGTGRGSFATSTSSVRVGAYPAYLMTADVDADGDLDLLVANTGANSVSVRFNDGLGDFSGSQEVAVGSYPISVAAADFDGDGDLDLVAANLGSDNASVRFNDGLGTFSGSQNVAAGLSPSSVAAADVDNDGDLDLLLANASRAGTVSIRLNDGLGGFSGSQHVAVGSYPTHVTAADLNGDGNLDLLTANATDPGTVSIALGDGRGGFVVSTTLAVGRRPASVAAADVDGDGDLDVLTANAASNTVSVRLNSGQGTFSGSQEVAVGCAPLRVALADLDGDGDLDLATADAGGGSVSVRLNQAPVGSSAARTSALSSSPAATSPLHPFADGNLFRQLTGQPSAAEERLATSLDVYPNPATATTHVRFVLAQDEVVSLQLYNALGQRVATLYQGPAAAGQVVEQPLATLALPTGVYLCRLTLHSGSSLSQRLVVE